MEQRGQVQLGLPAECLSLRRTPPHQAIIWLERSKPAIEDCRDQVSNTRHRQKWVPSQTIRCINHVNLQKDPSVATLPDITHAPLPRIRHWLRPPIGLALKLFSKSPDDWPLAHFHWQSLNCDSNRNWLYATIFFLKWHIHWRCRVLELQTVELHLSAWRWPVRLKRIEGSILPPWATNERRWPGRRPSGPPEATAWKDFISFRIYSYVVTAGTTDPSDGSGKLRFSEAEGCFSFKAVSVSPSWGAKPSADTSSLNAHSHHPRQIWPQLFSSELHPLHRPHTSFSGWLVRPGDQCFP